MEKTTKKINLAYKFKLIPTKEQSSVLSSWGGSCRFLYNIALEHRIINWQRGRKVFNYYDQANQLKEMKKVEGFEWFKEVPAQCYQQVLKDLDKAFKSFWKSSCGFPKFKKKSRMDSFRFPAPSQFKVLRISCSKAIIKLPKIGDIKFMLSRKIDGVIKNATIRKELDGWYVSFCCEKEIYIKPMIQSSIGIDRGIAQTIALSNETKYTRQELELPKSCMLFREQIKILQRKLKLKKKFSKKWHTLQNRIRKLHKKISRIRQDFLHKISSKLAKSHGLITLEDLKIKNMSSSAKGDIETHGVNVKAKSGLNREILFQGWGIFANMLSYKCSFNNSHLELVKPHLTSQRCSSCLFSSKLNRQAKKFCCVNCGFTEDADKNAAINIDRAGHAQRDLRGIDVSQAVEKVTA